jgi:hypothetical protein
MRQFTFSRSFFSEMKAQQSNPTVWSKFSTLSPCLLADSPRSVSECLEKITFVWRQGVAQELRCKSFSKKFQRRKKSYEEIGISKTDGHSSGHLGAVRCGLSSNTE